MTKDDIKKAFDICCSVQSCTDCPILTLEKQNGHKCKYNLFVSVINLTTKQEEEIDALKAENRQLKTECALLDDELRIARQDTIDVLNKLKDYVNQLACDEYGDSACDTNYVTIDIDKYEQDIDEMIEELTKCRR